MTSNPRPLLQRPARADGFTLLETLVAVTITTLAGGALLTAVSTSARVATDSYRRQVARGMAMQLIDEVAIAAFPASRHAGSTASTRSRFVDMDDFDGWSASPPESRNGQALGTEGPEVAGRRLQRPPQTQLAAEFIARFRREIEVVPVRPNGPQGWQESRQHTSYRRISVTVTYTSVAGESQTLATADRIVSKIESSN